VGTRRKVLKPPRRGTGAPIPIRVGRVGDRSGAHGQPRSHETDLQSKKKGGPPLRRCGNGIRVNIFRTDVPGRKRQERSNRKKRRDRSVSIETLEREEKPLE